MNALRIKKIWRGLRAMARIMEWDQLYEYASKGSGLELIEFNPKSSPQKVVVLSPHPDDEVFGCGGTLARHSQHNDSVEVVYFTDGSRGTPSGTRDKGIIEVREREAKEGLEILGNIEPLFWRFADNQFEVTKTSVGLLSALLEKSRPNIIYVPWYADDHTDHKQAVPLLFQALSTLKTPLDAEIWQYEVWTPLTPNRMVTIGDVLEEKIKAIEAHKSQLASRQYRDGILGLNTYRGAFADLDELAEAFFALPTERFLHFCTTILKLEKMK